MIGLVIGLAGAAAVVAAGVLLAWSGLRAGDQPGDLTVTVMMGAAVQPDGCRPVAVAAVHNPGPSAVLVGLTVRATRVPGWLDGGLAVSVPARTTRPHLRPGRQDVLGVAGPGARAQWQVPVPAPPALAADRRGGPGRRPAAGHPPARPGRPRRAAAPAAGVHWTPWACKVSTSRARRHGSGSRSSCMRTPAAPRAPRCGTPDCRW